MNSARPTSRQDQRRLTRRRICEAARRCFYEYGVANTSIDQIARAAGVGRATLYLHFSNKEGILLELLESNLRGVRRIFGQLNGLERVDKASAKRWLEAYVAELRRHRDAMPLFQLGLATDPSARRLLDEHRNCIAEALSEHFPAESRADVRARTRLILAVARVDQVASAAAADEPHIDIDVAMDLAAEELAAVLNGVST